MNHGLTSLGIRQSKQINVMLYHLNLCSPLDLEACYFCVSLPLNFNQYACAPK